jgi:hypothetical protein
MCPPRIDGSLSQASFRDYRLLMIIFASEALSALCFVTRLPFYLSTRSVPTLGANSRVERSIFRERDFRTTCQHDVIVKPNSLSLVE